MSGEWRVASAQLDANVVAVAGLGCYWWARAYSQCAGPDLSATGVSRLVGKTMFYRARQTGPLCSGRGASVALVRTFSLCVLSARTSPDRVNLRTPSLGSLLSCFDSREQPGGRAASALEQSRHTRRNVQEDPPHIKHERIAARAESGSGASDASQRVRLDFRRGS